MEAAIVRFRSADRSWDLWAIGLSSACMLHCLMPLVFLSLLPNALAANGSHEIHLLLVLLAVPITLYVIWNEQAKDTGTVLFRAAALIGLTTLVLAATVIESESLEAPLTMAGGLLLAGAHLWRCWHHPGTCTSIPAGATEAGNDG